MTDKIQITPILVRHEETASFMADGYFRASHKPIAVFAHTGLGAANLLIGVAVHIAPVTV